MRAVITVVGRDRTGIIAGISSVLAEHEVNILDLSQTILQEFFTMIMVVELKDSKSKFEDVQKYLEAEGLNLGLSVKIQHEDIFNSMHKI